MTPDPTLSPAEEALRGLAEHLASATVAADPAPVVASAIRQLVAVLSLPSVYTADRAFGDVVADGFGRALAPLVAAVAPHISGDRVALHLAAAANLARCVGRTGPDMIADGTADYVADFADLSMILVAELDVLHRRRQIAARGHRYARLLAVRAAAFAPAPPAGAPLH